MNPRRQNDLMKLLGAFATGLAVFNPIFSKPFVSIQALLWAMLPLLSVAITAFIAGLGTRGRGLEYEDVAEAKVIQKLSSAPPPMPPAPPPIGR
jgi:hypothetical protein